MASTRFQTRFGSGLVLALAVPLPALAQGNDADPALVIDAEYEAGLVTVARGPATGTRRVDYIDVMAAASLEQAIGWRGATVVAHAIANTGQTPNDLAGTLQGIDNDEVPGRRVRLFEAYVEQQVTAINGSVKVGLSDLNADFYATASSDLLMAPSFGIGPELSATGPKGPSIFPSTAPGVQARAGLGRTGYLQAAVISAEAGVPGDPHGIRPLFRHGALVIAEAGRAGARKLAVGAWTYTGKQDALGPAGNQGPSQARAQGAYALADIPIAGDDSRGVSLFARAGISDGRTTAFAGAWQAGLLFRRPFARLPENHLSIGFDQAFLSRGFRRDSLLEGQAYRRVESAVELTFALRPCEWLSVQPDAQYVWNAARGPAGRDSLVMGLRLTLSHSWVR